MKSGTGTILGLDIGGSKIAVVEGDSDARILQRQEIATQPHQPFYQRFPHLVALVDDAGSDGRRNTCLEFTRWSLKSQSFSWTLIQAQLDLVELRLSDGS